MTAVRRPGVRVVVGITGAPAAPRSAPALRLAHLGDDLGADRRPRRGRGARSSGADVRGRRAPLRAGRRRGPRAGHGDRVRRGVGRGAGVAAARRPVPAADDPHDAPRRAPADRLGVVPGGAAPARALLAAQGRVGAGAGRRRAARAVGADAGHAAAGDAAPAAVARRPGLRRRGAAGRHRAHRPARGRPSWRAVRPGLRLRGVHVALRGLVGTSRPSVGCSRRWPAR